MTAGATDVVPPVVGAAGASEAGRGASTGACAGINAPPLGTLGATGGVSACGAGGDPASTAFIAPADSDCPPAPAGCPVAIPLANDWPSPGDMPCPAADGDIDPPGIADIPGIVCPPAPGSWTFDERAGEVVPPCEGPPGDTPPVPGPPANPVVAGAGACGPTPVAPPPLPPPLGPPEVPTDAWVGSCTPAPWTPSAPP